MIDLILRLAGRGGTFGQRGERVAARWLRRRGFRIVERNRRAGKDEADIVAIDPDGRTLVVVEVKTRRDDRILPEEQVNRAKQYHLARLASRLMKQSRYRGRPIRFDVIAVVWPEGARPTVQHYESAFESPI